MSASMAEGIAEVLTAHQKIRVFGWRCRCGVLLDGDPAVESLAAHQAEQLAANGYGKLEDAFEQGRKSGMRHADRVTAALKIGRPELAGPPSPNPYRTKEN